MRTSPFAQPGTHEGEFTSEICLPVRVRYRALADGEVELTKVDFLPSQCLPTGFELHWHLLDLKERDALQEQAIIVDAEGQRL